MKHVSVYNAVLYFTGSQTKMIILELSDDVQLKPKETWNSM